MAYGNLTGVAGALRLYGRALKIVAIAVAVLGVGYRIYDGDFGANIFVALGLVSGLFLHAAGTMVAAFGEALLALADIATQTATTAQATTQLAAAVK